MFEDDQKRLLGEFVRAHRERLAPDQPAGRRRTPGLRREELAARAGISATWCAWIEQARDVQASPHALGRLAKALQLTRAERAYMFDLAGRRDPDAAAHADAEDAPSSLRAMVTAIDHPAYGLDRFWNACAWNASAEDLFIGWLGTGHQRNLLRYIFLDPASRVLIPDWEDRARRVLAEFRADYSHSLHDPEMNTLLTTLRQQSPFFAKAWSEQIVLDREGGLRVFSHPARGALSYEQHTFRPSDRPDHKLVILIPAP
ncbi:helix-turn-helix transcriptional regulator [Rhizobium sp. LjRoot254]|uniref:helix-turn-helix transcriptional regulator n=1 Tax=Rhizobium sp. LjRoot254 TaxID=3342297 RepID=UPI003ECC3A73